MGAEQPAGRASHRPSVSLVDPIAKPLENEIEPPIAFPLDNEVMKWRTESRAVLDEQLRRLLEPNKRYLGQPPVSTLRLG